MPARCIAPGVASMSKVRVGLDMVASGSTTDAVGMIDGRLLGDGAW
jgi:hypothetical protein